jgi:lipopolysaccharide export system protein LptC
MKNIAYLVLALIAAAIAAWRMWIFATAKTSAQQNSDLIISVVCILLAIVFAGLLLAGKVNKEEEIHITK